MPKSLPFIGKIYLYFCRGGQDSWSGCLHAGFKRMPSSMGNRSGKSLPSSEYNFTSGTVRIPLMAWLWFGIAGAGHYKYCEKLCWKYFQGWRDNNIHQRWRGRFHGHRQRTRDIQRMWRDALQSFLHH